ncbi:MAG: tetratricopeptide repeat protein [Comamonadaceae bacterium]|nr:tetratricopeptide repeat protein [Comamonadaceae bacterium]
MPQPGTHGVVQSALKDLNGALASQTRAVGLSARFIDARVARAGLLINLNREKEAQQELDQLASLALIDPRASFMRGLLASRNGDIAAAKLAYGEAVGLIDSLPPSILSNSTEVLMTGALAHRALGNREKAKAYLENLLKLDAKHVGAQVLLASMLLEVKDHAGALPLLESAQRTNPDDPHVLYLLGTLRLDRKQCLLASQLFEQAIARGGEPSLLRELGVSQLGLVRVNVGWPTLRKFMPATRLT